MSNVTLFKHQIKALEDTKGKNRVAYYLDMGLGKTFVGSEKMKAVFTPRAFRPFWRGACGRAYRRARPRLSLRGNGSKHPNRCLSAIWRTMPKRRVPSARAVSLSPAGIRAFRHSCRPAHRPSKIPHHLKKRFSNSNNSAFCGGKQRGNI